MRRRFQIGMGVNPSLIINKGIYIQHVDGGLYTKENWSNKGYSNDLCNGIALVDKVCFVIATEYIGTFRWGKDGKIDNIFAQDSSHIGTIKKDYWGRENQNAYLEYDTSNTDSWYYDINIQGDHLDTGSRGSSHYVRPFTKLIL